MVIGAIKIYVKKLNKYIIITIYFRPLFPMCLDIEMFKHIIITNNNNNTS